ncbi:MAG: hypothetical protein IIA33_10945, partial [Planctomycetes bacterium]|nr:hypothetical protein [Planctomycetota bacterium]
MAQKGLGHFYIVAAENAAGRLERKLTGSAEFMRVLNFFGGGIQAHKLIQRACRAVGGDIEDDGVLGPKSILAINTAVPKLLITAMRCTQAGFYYALV